jgi:hypothetical protein
LNRNHTKQCTAKKHFVARSKPWHYSDQKPTKADSSQT